MASTMEFEFDPEKSKANAAKHGIDFVAAQALWLDERRVEVPARTLDEPRWVIISSLAGKLWAAVVTMRGERTRIISVRRARDEEVAIYES
jgi:hypothetical protein